MSDLISRSALQNLLKHKKEAFKYLGGNEYALKAFDYCINRINDAPTIEAAPVVHGEWIETHDKQCGIWYYECSKCEEGFATKEKCQSLPNFCNECGASMKGGE